MSISPVRFLLFLQLFFLPSQILAFEISRVDSADTATELCFAAYANGAEVGSLRAHLTKDYRPLGSDSAFYLARSVWNIPDILVAPACLEHKSEIVQELVDAFETELKQTPEAFPAAQAILLNLPVDLPVRGFKNSIFTLSYKSMTRPVPAGLNIRWATLSDIRTIVQMYNKTAKFHQKMAPNFYFGDKTSYVFRALAMIPFWLKGNLLVAADQDGKILGFRSYYLAHEDRGAGEKIVSRGHELYVSKAARASGVGAALLARSINESRHSGAELVLGEVSAKNHSALAFYRGLGHQVIQVEKYKLLSNPQ